MKLAILSRAPRSYSTQRLRTAAADRGHTVKVLNTLRFGIDLSADEPDLQFRGKPLSSYDAILPGALATADVVDLLAALAPRRVLLGGLVDGLNRAVPPAVAERELAAARGPSLALGDEDVVGWLAR